jgi:SIR2-like domain
MRLAKERHVTPAPHSTSEDTMTHILLTGSGFSKNWGGLVASEFFSRLLSEDLDTRTRELLFKARTSGGFEAVMQQLQGAGGNSPEDQKRLHDFTTAVIGIFNGMNNQFLRTSFEFQNEVRYMVRAFLERFDAIFTLNQDCLLEAQYFYGFVGGRWNRADLPGTRVLGPPPHIQGAREERIALRTSDIEHYLVQPRAQPYFKLHGSSNWMVDGSGGRLLILGGHKAASISQHLLLTRYQQEFNNYISRAGARLMIIGYGFNDEHINEAIASAVDKGLKLFIVDPRGVDVFDKFDGAALIPGPQDPYAEKLRPNIVGESTKPLTLTFGTDHGEHSFLTSFFR